MSDNKVLFLGPEDSPLIDWLREQNEQVIQRTSRISPQLVERLGCAFLVSYGYRHVIGETTHTLFPNRAINLHISYLPWNRGADPNLWSFIEDTPKGVTIHHLDRGLDTGDIIAQEELAFDIDEDTLATSYEKLHGAIQNLFKQYWPAIKNGTAPRHKQVGRGSSHRSKDKEALSHLLTDGWNTKISVFYEYAARNR